MLKENKNLHFPWTTQLCSSPSLPHPPSPQICHIFFKRAYNSYNLLQKNDSHCKEVFASSSRGSPWESKTERKQRERERRERVHTRRHKSAMAVRNLCTDRCKRERYFLIWVVFICIYTHIHTKLARMNAKVMIRRGGFCKKAGQKRIEERK